MSVFQVSTLVRQQCVFLWGGGGRYYTGRKPLLLRSVNGAIKSCNSPFSILTRLVLSSNFRKLSFWILCPPMAILLASPRVQKPAFLFVVDVRYSFLYLFIGFSCIFFLIPFHLRIFLVCSRRLFNFGSRRPWHARYSNRLQASPSSNKINRSLLFEEGRMQYAYYLLHLFHLSNREKKNRKAAAPSRRVICFVIYTRWLPTGHNQMMRYTHKNIVHHIDVWLCGKRKLATGIGLPVHIYR